MITTLHSAIYLIKALYISRIAQDKLIVNRYFKKTTIFFADLDQIIVK